jgi:hypothetical protein
MIAASINKDVLDAFEECRQVSDIQRQWMLGQGVPANVLASGDAPVFARVWFDEGGLFEMDAEGEGALIFLAREAAGPPMDLVAWQPKAGRLATWLGRAAILGNPYAPRLRADRALPVWRSPLGWLKGSMAGVCIVHEERSALLLEGLGPLLAEDVEHGVALSGSLAIPAPRILVPEEQAS